MQKLLNIIIAVEIILTLHVAGRSELYPVQIWEKTIGDGTNSYYNGGKIIQTLDSTFIVLPLQSGKKSLIHFTESGDTLGSKIVPLNGNLNAIRQNSDGGYIIAGTTGGSSTGDLLVGRTKSNGDTMWTKIYPSPNYGPDTTCQNSYATDIQILEDGTSLILGHRVYSFRLTESMGATISSMVILKIDPQGNTLWTKSFFAGTTLSSAKNIYATLDGGCRIYGRKLYYDPSTSASHGNIWYLALNADGTTKVSREYALPDNSPYETAINGMPTSDGGNIIVYLNSKDSSIVANRTKLNGDTLWSKRIASVLVFPTELSVQTTFDSGLVCIFEIRKNNVSSPFIVRIDSNGNVIWSTIHSNCSSGLATMNLDIKPTSNSCYIVIGKATKQFGLAFSPVLWLGKIMESPPPKIVSSVAGDNVIQNDGIDIDDYVLVTFANSVCFKNARFFPYYTINSATIDSLLPLSNGHSWLSGAGMLGGVTWNKDSSKLAITLSSIGGMPTVATGDAITLPATGQTAIITGSFGPTAVIESRKALTTGNTLKIVPAKLTIRIVCSVAEKKQATLQIFNVKGELLATLFRNRSFTSNQTHLLNTTNHYSPGVYFAVLQINGAKNIIEKFTVR